MAIAPAHSHSVVARQSRSAIEFLSVPLIMAATLAAIIGSAWAINKTEAWTGSGQVGSRTAIYGFAAICTLLSLWLIMWAVFAYLNVGQAKKIEFITGFYSADTIADYFYQFWAGRADFQELAAAYRSSVKAATTGKSSNGDVNTAANALYAAFQTMFKDDYGSRVYAIPAALVVAAGGIVLFFGYVGGIGLALSLSDKGAIAVHPLGISMDLVSVAAIFGTYTWIATDVIVRNHQWTLHPSDLAWYALRLVIAIPLGQALALTVGGDVTAGASGSSLTQPGIATHAGPFVAFAAGMFSLDSITRMLTTALTRFNIKLINSDDERDDLIIKLTGVDEDKARALRMEGVSTITQLIAVDPTRTSIRSGLPFEYVLDMIDAAMLWDFVGDKVKVLRPLGVRGASDLLVLDGVWRDNDPFERALAAYRAANAAPPPAAGSPPPGLPDATQNLLAAALQQASLPLGGRDAMHAAWQVATDAGGPALTAVGFDTIICQLRGSSYAHFICKLLHQ